MSPNQRTADPKAAAETAVVLLNMGGPAKPEDAEPFLAELFADPAIIKLPLGKLYQKRLARFIAKKRAPKVAPHYERIGGSPLLAQTQAQARALAEATGLRVRIAMRYTPPRAEQTVRELAESGVRRIIALPLYPQFSGTTSASSIDELNEIARAHGVQVAAVKSYPAHGKFIEALLARWTEKIGPRPSDDTHVLLAAHGIPLSYARKGDPYLDEVHMTAEALKKRLPDNVYASVAYQSRVGPVKWAPPYLDDEIRRLGSEGVRRLVVFPITFVSEHFETLYELDIMMADLARECGIEEYLRVGTVSDHPLFISLLADLALGGL